MEGLTRKEQLFVLAIMSGSTQYDAARIAGYAGSTIMQFVRQGNQVYNRPKVRAAIQGFVEEQAQEGVMSALEVLARLTAQARNEGAEYIRSDGTVDLAAVLEDGKGHLIKSVRPGRYGTVVEFYDSQKALELLGKYHGLFTDRVEQETSVTIQVQYAESEYDLTLHKQITGEHNEENKTNNL